MEKVNVVIVGAGAVGLSIAAELSRVRKDIVVVERNPSFGQETSSRNSEVIHAGIYYPKDSLKSKTCLEGKVLLYEFCARNDIPYKRTGKLIIAINKSEMKDLEKLYLHGRENGVSGLTLISKAEVKKIEPGIKAEAAIYSPSTGILDTHSFMKRLASSFEKNNGQIAYNSEVAGIAKTDSGYEVTVTDSQKESFTLNSNIVINCAGLNSDKVAAFIGLKKPEYRLKYCKGDYFRLARSKEAGIKHLVYPVPKEDRGGLGIHLTLDLAGSIRLGPDDEYVKEIDYKIDPSKAKLFYESVKTFLPFIKLEDIAPDTSGVRPKLQGEGEGFRDFIIRHEEESGFPGFINLIGIESPGLTASLSIAKMVSGIIKSGGIM
ncbi:MAG: NAD(P)/FAD-dependent oxidoreductase [Candidatus Omnitrophota bacterium]|nr:NAD(P)/FAD-dependent oxidoreductase [Candidatus Omnitrophota bacterium]